PGNNSDSLGIEHADVCNDPAPLTPALYQRSAELVRDLAARHGFALDATTVMGHRDAMPNHGDPGSYWDWEYYRQLLAWDGTTQQTRPVRVVAAAASLATTPAGWQVRQRRAIANHQCASRRDPWGERYWRARPTASGDAADITATVDQAGRYRVSLWWPAVPGANSEVPLEIEVAGGSRHNVNLDQRLNSGRWNDVVEADVPAAPCEVRVRFRRNASRPGWIVADAVRLLRIGPVQGAGELVETTDASTLPILRLGARGEPVRQLQTALGTHGLELQTDGSFGPLTHAAVQLFQRLYYLKPDGIVGPLTWRALLDRPYGDLRTAADLVAEFAEQSPLQKILPADFEMPSWVFPQTKGTPALLGMIFFPTNQVDLDAGDKQQLDRLVDIIAAQTTSYFPGDPNRPLVMLPGHADPRTTTRKGGNEQLSIDRSASVLRYLTTELDRRDAAKGNDPGTWRGKVAFESYGVGVDPALKKLAPGYPFMRMVALVRTRGDDFVLRDVPAATCAEAKARAREVLRKSPGSFLKEELRRLTHMCRDRTTEDGFLKFDDPQFIKEVHGASKKLWSEDELDRFMNRHRFCGHLQRFAGPTARDQDVIGVLHYLHGTMAAAIFEMHKAQIIADATKDYAPVPNQHRKQLINRVADGTRNPKSVYFNFGPVSGSQFEVLEEEEEEQEEAIPAGPLLEASPTAPPCAGAATILGRFPTAKTTLNQEQRAMVESLARDIAASQGSETPVQSVCVVGHTDSAGNAEQNLELGATRARAAETELRAALDRIQPGLSGRLSFSRDSRGESSPAASNATEDGRALNRRVEITLGRAERIAAPHIEPADAETPLTTEGFAEQAATGPFVVPTGTAGRVFLTRRGGPFLEWSTSDPTIARVSPISDSQALPNQTTVFGLRPGTTEL
ncbi:MAG TPA: OmpA family protein, partial [Gemmatimonadales bacterium]|nr:OmpA family protein [Gemmatimonadales bacterium]